MATPSYSRRGGGVSPSPVCVLSFVFVLFLFLEVLCMSNATIRAGLRLGGVVNPSDGRGGSEGRRLNYEPYNLWLQKDPMDITITNDDLIRIWNVTEMEQRSRFVGGLINRYSVMKEKYISSQLIYLNTAYRPPLIISPNLADLMASTTNFVGAVGRIQIGGASVQSILSAYQGPTTAFSWGLQRAIADTAKYVFNTAGKVSESVLTAVGEIDDLDAFVAATLDDGTETLLSNWSILPTPAATWYEQGLDTIKSNTPARATVFQDSGLPSSCLATDVELVNNNILTVTGDIQTPSKCNKKCIETNDCGYWTFVSTQNVCHLKNTFTNYLQKPASAEARYYSGTRGCEIALDDEDMTLRVNYFIVRPNSDATLEEAQKARMELIMEEVNKNILDFESYFHYHTDFGRRLVNFTHSGNTLLSAGTVDVFSAVKDAREDPYTDSSEVIPEGMRQHIDFFGYDIIKEESGMMLGYTECKQLCDREADCTHWVHWRSMNWCYIKSELFGEAHKAHLRTKDGRTVNSIYGDKLSGLPPGFIEVPKSLQFIAGADAWTPTTETTPTVSGTETTPTVSGTGTTPTVSGTGTTPTRVSATRV